MRKRFEAQFEIELKSISETPVLFKCTPKNSFLSKNIDNE